MPHLVYPFLLCVLTAVLFLAVQPASAQSCLTCPVTVCNAILPVAFNVSASSLPVTLQLDGGAAECAELNAEVGAFIATAPGPLCNAQISAFACGAIYDANQTLTVGCNGSSLASNSNFTQLFTAACVTGLSCLGAPVQTVIAATGACSNYTSFLAAIPVIAEFLANATLAPPSPSSSSSSSTGLIATSVSGAVSPDSCYICQLPVCSAYAPASATLPVTIALPNSTASPGADSCRDLSVDLAYVIGTTPNVSCAAQVGKFTCGAIYIAGLFEQEEAVCSPAAVAASIATLGIDFSSACHAELGCLNALVDDGLLLTGACDNVTAFFNALPLLAALLPQANSSSSSTAVGFVTSSTAPTPVASAQSSSSSSFAASAVTAPSSTALPSAVASSSSSSSSSVPVLKTSTAAPASVSSASHRFLLLLIAVSMLAMLA